MAVGSPTGRIDLGASHILSLMQMRSVEDPETGPALEMELRPEVTNPHGSLHGGLMGTLIECGAAGCAVRASGSVNIVASDMNIRFLSTVNVGPARVVSEVLRQGRRNIIVQASVIDVGDDRKVVASSTLSYSLLDDR
ncbi:MAG TPA: PaaI family thioesterase [Acidimicrobiales bacterium]|jgi:uncharacterized protein (TIGR00369 family)|nr:PaaI family thioesterase [Acidimicrobiales bacterium]